MVGTSKATGGRAVVRLALRASDCEDIGAGIVVSRRPLTLLVPRHLIELIDEGRADAILVDGTSCEGVDVLPSPALQDDDLALLRVRSCRIRKLSSIPLPNRLRSPRIGESVRFVRPQSSVPSDGTIQSVRTEGGGVSIATDVPVTAGDSGCAVMVDGALSAVCQGMAQRDGSSHALAVPLSEAGLIELRRVRRRIRMNAIGALAGVLAAIALAFLSFSVYSSRHFVLGSVEVTEDGGVLTGRNQKLLTLHVSWTRSFPTSIFEFEPFSAAVGGPVDLVAVGTRYEIGSNGTFYLLDARGRIQWSYAVPDGECIYASESETYDGYIAAVIHAADLDDDGTNEILVAFVHNHHEPCKLMVFSLQGEVLGEYWHPGYIRTIGSGPVGPDGEFLVVLSASNNAIDWDWWHPQTLFAFRGADIHGAAPPTDYLGASGRDVPAGSELWYKVFVNLDPDRIRAKCREIDIRDFDGDGIPEIQAALTDGRFYYLDAEGHQLFERIGDAFQRDFPGELAPPLLDIETYVSPEATEATDETHLRQRTREHSE